MIQEELIGRRVRFAAWNDLKEITGDAPLGLITHVTDHGREGVDVGVQVEGLGLRYTFDLDDLELMPVKEYPFYSIAAPWSQGDRIELYPSLEAARAVADGRSIYGVAVGLGPRGRCLILLEAPAPEIDPTWMTPAERHPDGSVTAKAPIPEALFVEFSCAVR